MKTTLLAFLLAIALSTGCASMYLGSTEACYKTADGTEICYKSNKNQESFSAKVGLDAATGKLNNLDIQTTATTPESAIAATAQFNMKLLEFAERMSQQIATKGAGGAGGAPFVPGAGGLSPVPFATRP